MCSTSAKGAVSEKCAGLFPISERHIFSAGTTHKLLLHPEYSPPGVIIPVIATVLKPFEPFTMSPVLHVALQVSAGNSKPQLPSEAIIKLYDKRCMSNDRDDYGSEPWSPSRERALTEFKAGGGWKGGQVRNPINPSFDWGEWTIGEMESFFEITAENNFKNELAVYHRLRSFQGIDIPKLYGEVTISFNNPCLIVHGLLLDYIPSFTLREVRNWVPKQDWQWIEDQAVALVNRVSDQGIVNQDVRLDNILVSTTYTGSKRLVMIDFAMARIRREEEDDEAWRQVKWDQDEEGAIGFVLMQHLKGEYKYNRSLRYLNLARPDYHQLLSQTQK